MQLHGKKANNSIGKWAKNLQTFSKRRRRTVNRWITGVLLPRMKTCILRAAGHEDCSWVMANSFPKNFPWELLPPRLHVLSRPRHNLKSNLIWRSRGLTHLSQSRTVMKTTPFSELTRQTCVVCILSSPPSVPFCSLTLSRFVFLWQ